MNMANAKKAMFQCQATCVDTMGSAPAQQFQGCLERCTEPVAKLFNAFQQELKAFQVCCMVPSLIAVGAVGASGVSVRRQSEDEAWHGSNRESSAQTRK